MRKLSLACQLRYREKASLSMTARNNSRVGDIFHDYLYLHIIVQLQPLTVLMHAKGIISSSSSSIGTIIRYKLTIYYLLFNYTLL